VPVIKPRRNQSLKVKMTDAEYAFYTETAASANKSLSQFVRDAMAIHAAKHNKTSNEDDLTKIKVNLSALNKIGNNLNQIAYSLNKLWYKKAIAPAMYRRALEELFTISTLLSNFSITKK